MNLDTSTKVGATVIGCVVAAVFGLWGVHAAVGYVTCHQQVEQTGLPVVAAYDPFTGNCTVHL